jgi:threonine aldolase
VPEQAAGNPPVPRGGADGIVIDLRSDTQTAPTAAMRDAMATAQVGDEQKREDPTVLELERRASELLALEEAVFLPTATMANQIALRTLSTPGDEVVADARAHIFRAELGGVAVHSGLAMKAILTDDGTFTSQALRDAVNRRSAVHAPTTRVVCIENTHNAGGGRVWPLDQLREVLAEAREQGLRAHLDGARIMNAAVAEGVNAAEYAQGFDTVTLCLSKGLGCPLGALLGGSSHNMQRARRYKHLFGGAMRQAGIVAAAGLYALDHNVARLADDHDNARTLCAGLADLGLPVDLAQVDTNFVLIDVGELGLSEQEALERLRSVDVLLSEAADRDVLRAVTHLGVARDDIQPACERIARALSPSRGR